MKKYLLVIVLAGLLLRLYGAGHGLSSGRTFHPDTFKQMMFFRHYLEGDYRIRFRIAHRDYYGYPTFHIHIAEWAYRGMSGLGGITRHPEREFDGRQQWFFLRIMTALFSAAAVVFVYLAGKELFSERAGLLAAAILAVNPFSVSMSHFIMSDTAMTFFAAAAFYFFILCYKKQSVPMYLAGGLFAGFSAACKYNGGFAVIPGLFALFAVRPGRRTIYCFLALFFGGALGFTVGNPSMFTHFSEGLRGVSSFLAYAGSLGWDGSEPRALAALRVFPAHLKMLVNVFGVLQLVVLSAALAWMLREKRGMKSLFAAAFPVSYFFLSIVSQPYPRALYLLVMAPFLSVLIGWFLAEARAGKKNRGAVLACAAALLLAHGLYFSWQESFLFSVGDTRLSAEEWLERNVPPYFRIDGSWYSAANPHEGADIREWAGSFFVSSGLAGMPHPEGGLPVKKFSHEDAPPPVLHRNPDIKVFAYYGEELRPGFKMPVFNRLPYHGNVKAPLFLNGTEFGLDPFKFFIGGGRDFMYAGGEPAGDISILLVNFDKPARVSVGSPGRSKEVELASFESKLITIEKPLRRPPFNRYYYNLSFRIREPAVPEERARPRVFARVGFTGLQKAKMHLEAGLFDTAAAYFGSAAGSAACPVELEIMRAYAHKKAGRPEKASGISKNIRYWAEELPADAPDSREYSPSFRERFLENTGISMDYLEEVNKIRFEGHKFASARGRVTECGEKGRAPAYFHAVRCGEGESDIIFGPYMPFPPGNYFARFAVNMQDSGPGTRMKFDVSSRVGEKMFAEKEITASGFADLPQILLPFTVEARTEFLEFRTFLDGPGKVVLNYVEIFPDIEKNTLDKAVLLRRIREGK